MLNYKRLIHTMTLKEKVSLLSGKDFWQTQDLPFFNIPSIYLSDGPHGVRKQAISSDHLGLNTSLKATCFPSAVTIACSWDISLAKEIGKKIGQEAASQGVNVLLGPGVNIKRNPRCGRNFEYFSEDPYLTGKLAASYIKGVQENGISACVKHFAANNQEHRRLVSDSIVDERTLHEVYLLPFEISIKEGKTKALMTSYNLVNGEYSNENIYLLRQVLRDTWHYGGVVITDWGGSNNRVKGLMAGSDLEMPSTNGETNIEVMNAVENGVVKESILDESVARLLNLIEDTSQVDGKDVKTFDVEEHHIFARKAAEESIVLLKNKNNILPLKTESRIALIGEFAETPRYQGSGSSIVNPTRLEATTTIIKETKLNIIGFERGFDRYGKHYRKLITKAVDLAKKAEIILLYLGLDEFSETEGKDKKDLKLPDNQIQLISELTKLNKPIVVTLSYGSVVEIPYVDQVDAIVHGFLGGQAGATAMLNVLTGVVNPSGKLTETIAKKYEDYPSAKNYPGHELTSEYREALYVGYRYFEKIQKKPLYPFGFGLSYTTFAYQSIALSHVGVMITIKNIGDVFGKEVVQLYIEKVDSAFYRPIKELKGFEKVELKPGETKSVSFVFDEYTFRYYNVETKQFEIEGGLYNIFIGSSSSNTPLSGSIILKGTTNILPYQNLNVPSYDTGYVQNVNIEEFQKILGRKVPNSKISFYKKNRLHANKQTLIEDLKYAKGCFGRLIYYSIKFGILCLKLVGKRDKVNMLEMGVLQQPLRGISRLSGGKISWEQLQGIIQMINGHFIKGLHQFIKERRRKHRLNKNKIE